ncbi:MAG TPA: hypothetical protein VKR06_36125, partial [Ktedonosporobacter sp.]|nr:hypothetical protein [Ktedonosporobacter sp.]
MPGDGLHLLRFSPQEQCYTITHGSLGPSQEISVGESAWEEWLNTVSSFAFEDREGVHYTIRKERLQRGGAYWYAYRSIQGRTKKRYLGRSADLTIARLEEVSALFTAEERKAFQSVSTHQPLQMATRRRAAPRVVPLLESKLHPPQLLSSLVERTRLLAGLDNRLAHKITLVQAPAGFGKTTLVSQWLATRCATDDGQSRDDGQHHLYTQGMQASWVSLDVGDNDPLRFWRYVMTACQGLVGQERRAEGQAALALLTTAVQPPFDAPPIEMALTEMLNALAEGHPQGSPNGARSSLADPSSRGLLVLDDYHVISEPLIHEMLAFFIDHLPGSVHVLLLSRAEPDLPLLRWRARGEMSELRGAELRFSAEEMTTFLSQALPISLSEVTLTRLEASLEGWAAGLRLLSLALSGWRTSTVVEQALLSLGEYAGFSERQKGGADSLHRSLLDYFVSEILETQPEPIQHFLLQTSVLNRLCAPLCDAVTAKEGSGEQLEAVARAGLFLETLEGPGGWYRYHMLFAEAMRREASRRLGEEELRALSLRASYWYEQEELLTEAIEAAWLAQDMERMAGLIEQIDVVNFYEPQTMRRWLEQLPEAVLYEHPILCHLYAVELRFPVELRFSAIPAAELTPLSEAEQARIEALLHMAEEGWRKRGMLAWIGTNRAFCALSVLVDQGPFPDLVNYAQQALDFLLMEGTLDRRLQMYRSSCRLFVGIDKLRLGQVSEARQLLLQAQQDNVPPGNKYLAVDIHLMLGKSHLIQGELKLASRYLRQVCADARELADNEVAADTLLELAWLAFEWNDLTGTEQLVHEALELAQLIHPQVQTLHARAELLLALLQHVRGETVAALERLTALQASPQEAWTPSSFWLASHLRDWQGRLSIATGDDVLRRVAPLEGARVPVGEFLPNEGPLKGGDPMRPEHPSITEQLGAEMLRGRLWMAQGKVKDALQ